MPQRAAADEGLSRLGMRVLVALCAYVDPDGKAFPSQTTLAADCNLKRRQSVNEAIRELIDRGYIELSGARRRRNGKWGVESYQVLYTEPPNFAAIKQERSATRPKRNPVGGYQVRPVPDMEAVSPSPPRTGHGAKRNSSDHVPSAPDTGQVRPVPDTTMSAPYRTQTAHLNFPKSEAPILPSTKFYDNEFEENDAKTLSTEGLPIEKEVAQHGETDQAFEPSPDSSLPLPASQPPTHDQFRDHGHRIMADWLSEHLALWPLVVSIPENDLDEMLVDIGAKRMSAIEFFGRIKPYAVAMANPPKSSQQTATANT